MSDNAIDFDVSVGRLFSKSFAQFLVVPPVAFFTGRSDFHAPPEISCSWQPACMAGTWSNHSYYAKIRISSDGAVFERSIVL
jgi:hypothetical protein